MAAAAILDFQIFEFLTIRTVKRAKLKLFPGINSFALTFTARDMTVPLYVLSRPSNLQHCETTAVSEQVIVIIILLISVKF